MGKLSLKNLEDNKGIGRLSPKIFSQARCIEEQKSNSKQIEALKQRVEELEKELADQKAAKAKETPAAAVVAAPSKEKEEKKEEKTEEKSKETKKEAEKKKE